MLPHNVEQFELPAELCAKPLCLVGVTGLDTVNNAIHKTIWDAFNSNRRVERAPITFKLLGGAHEFPIMKPKRNSYEWYIPKGILKRNWMNKHLNEIPAVIVVFYDLDWNDGMWNEKMIECSSRVQSMRAAIEGRTTKITVVLIQQTLPLPAGEDILAVERAVALCASCELTEKSLFVLPLGDHLQGYTVRLENAFYDLAQNYYHYETRNIKTHRDHLNKTTHQYLFIRHQFKMGFLNELKQDNHTALKHYTHAYNNLSELRIVDTNALEIKTIAGFINYKRCKLMFTLNVPRDAISQFKAHVDRFKSRAGFKELTFEHHAWLAKQFHVFGEIFDEAVKLGLPAIQTQHPGFYYQQAAQHAISRKMACQSLCQEVTVYPTPDPLEGIENMEFYGQRPWRPGKLSAEPPDPHKEQAGIQALQYLEKQTNHSNLIISYYGFAISQFKTYRCPRMRRHLVVQMADEYYNSQDYGKALTLLTHMLWDYRSEKWWNLISHILQKALNCAFLSANIQDYITLSLEILGNQTASSPQDKTRVLQNFMSVLKKQIPETEPNLPEQEVKKALVIWKNAVMLEPFCVNVDMSNVISCIDSKARFTQPKYEADQNVTIEIYIRSSCLQVLHFSHLSVTINTPSYSSEFAVSEGSPDVEDGNPTLLFEPNQIKRFIVECVPDVQDVGQEIQIGSILLQLGRKNERSALLRFTGTNNNNNHHELSHFRTQTQTASDFDNIKPLGSAKIVPRLSKVEVNVIHAQPALVGEWYEIKITVVNAELLPIKQVQVKVQMEIDEVGSELATEFSKSPDCKSESLPLHLCFPDLDVDAHASLIFYMRCQCPGDRNVTLKLSYIFNSSKSVESVKEQVVNVPVATPFTISPKYFSSRFEPITKFYVGESFIVMPQIKCVSPWPVDVQDSRFDWGASVKLLDGNVKSQVADVQLKNDEMAAEIFSTEVFKLSDQPLNMGQYTVFWKRLGSSIVNSTQVQIKGCTVDDVPLLVEMILPAHGYVRTPMSVVYSFSNRSSQLLQLDMSMDSSDAFMFAGYKQIQVNILPKSKKVLKYNLYPLVSGNVLLPKLKLTINEKAPENLTLQQSQLTDLLDRRVPTRVYIMPQTLGTPSQISSVTNTVTVQ